MNPGIRKKASVPRFTYHEIRYLSASIVVKNASETTVQGVMRHKSSHTTANHIHQTALLKDEFEKAFAR